MEALRILVVDDDEVDRLAVQRALRSVAGAPFVACAELRISTDTGCAS